MRDLKFRGISKETGKWVYGFYLFQSNKYHQILTGKWCNKSGSPDAYEVIAETVGQYSGIPDKNGNDIYEGDMVEIEGMGKFPVVFRDCYFGFQIGGDKEVHALGFVFSQFAEVIGSVHSTSNELDKLKS